MLTILHPEVDDLIAEARAHNGRQTRALVKTPEVRLMVVGMTAGTTWPEHRAAGRVLLRVERGCIECTVAGQRHRLQAGGLASIDAGEAHDVHALEDSAFLLVVAGAERTA